MEECLILKENVVLTKDEGGKINIEYLLSKIHGSYFVNVIKKEEVGGIKLVESFNSINFASLSEAKSMLSLFVKNNVTPVHAKYIIDDLHYENHQKVFG